MPDEITVRIPATSANLGPGFDCLGVALDCYNQVTLRRSLGLANHPMVSDAATAFFHRSGIAKFTFDWSIKGDIPRSRGMGSSVTVRLGILHGLNHLADHPLTEDSLYRLCAQLEGHPDNAAPAAFGGFTAALPDSTHFRCEISPALHFVFLVPPDEVETDSSRTKLPLRIPRADAIENTAHTSMVTAAFASQQYGLLKGSMQDWLHQPYRQATIPHLGPAIEAGVQAGALAGYLSGSGSSVACLTLEDPSPVASAMQATLPTAHTLILHADNTGVVPA